MSGKSAKKGGKGEGERGGVEELVGRLKGGDMDLSMLGKFEGLVPGLKKDFPSLAKFSSASSSSMLSEIKELIQQV